MHMFPSLRGSPENRRSELKTEINCMATTEPILSESMEALAQLEPRKLWHHPVEQDDIRPVFPCKGDLLFPAFPAKHFIRV